MKCNNCNEPIVRCYKCEDRFVTEDDIYCGDELGHIHTSCFVMLIQARVIE